MKLFLSEILIHTPYIGHYISFALIARRQHRCRVVKARVYNQHGLGLKPTHVILLCPWKRHFTALSPVWWSWQAVLNLDYIFSGQQYLGISGSRSG